MAETLFNLIGLPQRSLPYLIITIGLVGLILMLETWPPAMRSVERMGILGFLLGALKPLALISTILIIWFLQLNTLRMVIVASLLICGGLTAYREFRRRWKGGDRSSSSLLGGLTVIIQFLSLIMLAGAAAGSLLTLLLGPVQALRDERLDRGVLFAWLENFTGILWLLTLYYVIFYVTRRILGGTGFSWMDPPNWRTLLPHLKYTRALRSGRLVVSRLADTVRMAYINNIVAEDANGEIVRAVERAALIRPFQETRPSFSFALIGDPGEGDRSQINPWHREGQTAVFQKAVEVMDKAKVDAAESAAEQGLPLPNVYEQPGFVVISSDVVYPAGELMDYERALYRPYRTLKPDEAMPIYAIPGNHDWYNNLKGFFLNFAYPAAHERDTPWERPLRRGPWARYWPMSMLRWQEVRGLRAKYGLAKLGGIPGQPATQQRLPFFELAFDAPLSVLGVDSGPSGSLDPLQSQWLKRRLRRARSRGNLIMVILSEPLYVNGAFANRDGLCDLYATLREHEVDVIMGGDTHAYEHYEVRHTTAEGARHTAHHFVNGGGGAYLSWPIDYPWPLSNRVGQLREDVVYYNATTNSRDEVVLRNYFPSAQDMRLKFNGKSSPMGIPAHLRRFEPWLLAHGFTNVLDHDRPPLLQSFIAASMQRQEAEGQSWWELVLTPWFSHQRGNEMVPQNPIRLRTEGKPIGVPSAET